MQILELWVHFDERLCTYISSINWNLRNLFIAFGFFQYKLVHYENEHKEYYLIDWQQ